MGGWSWLRQWSAGFRAFLGRRLSPGEYLGLHLTVGLLLCLTAGMVFALVAENVVHHRPLTAWDEALADALTRHAQAHPALATIMKGLTVAGDKAFLTGLALALALALFLRGRQLLAAGVLLATGGAELIVYALKDLFHRERPPHHDPSIAAEGGGFPSGHVVISVVAYGMLAYLLVLLWVRRRWAQAAVVAGLGLLVLLVSFSRLYLRAHYLSDILGGFALGGLWLAVCITGMEMIRRWPRRQPP